MAERGGPRSDVEVLAAQVVVTAAERRRSGEYPADLDDRLRRHFAAIADGVARYPLGALAIALDHVAELTNVGRDRIDYSSTFPGGRVWHQAAGKAVGRQTDGVLRQVRELAVAIHGVLEQLASGTPDDIATLRGRIDAALDRLAVLERDGASHTVDLERRLDDLDRRLSDLAERYSFPGS